MALQVPPEVMGRPLVTPEFVAHAHAHGLHVHVWTINEPAEIERLLDLSYVEIDTIWSGSFVTQMTQALNKGDTVFSYRGYFGMSG